MPRFERIKKVPAYRVLADAIMGEILNGEIKVGEPLPTEARLCEMFGVNRSTVREGMRVLEEANLVRRENGKKLVVTHPSAEETGVQFKRALVLHEITFNELWEAVYTLEPAMARLAATKPNQELLDRLARNLDDTKDALSDVQTLADLDIEYHGLIAAMSSNRALNLSREPISHLFYPSFRRAIAWSPVAGKRMLDAHRDIFAAIRKGDPQAADAAMARHIRDFRRGLELANVNLSAAVDFEPENQGGGLTRSGLQRTPIPAR
jgi:GntR family transcriptional repressor for pyruvate dehydrogenase complex